jgi:cytochrome c
LDTLTKKIVAGGKGVWGQIPMAPHPNISQADASKMIKYILTLNTKTPATSTK